MAMARSTKLHIAMYPWFAFGHLTPYLHLSNELAERGHKITFILPKKAQSQLQHLNLHPTLITFHPLTIPHVDGLPPGAETASDVPFFMHHLLVTAMDRTADQVEAALRALKPDFLLFDFPYWAPTLASKLGIKSIYYSAVCAAALARHPVPEDRWAQWLSGFKPGSVIFCAFGSQNFPEKDQFQELLLGLELTGLPFLVALKPPTGAATIEEALPEGFQERVGGRGVVHGGWVPQPSILSHPSVGCFVSHCGFGSMWESLTSDPQIVLVPELPDQILNTRQLAEVLKVAVEIEKEENGWFSKKSLCRAVRSVMDEESEVGGLVRKNHAKWKETLTSQGFMSNYIENFVQQLQQLLDKK
ncbi:unnamed protein product, partial [Vitis vinifera]